MYIPLLNNDLSANEVAQYAADLTLYSASNLYTAPYDGYVFMQVLPDAAVRDGVALYLKYISGSIGLVSSLEKTTNVGNFINMLYVKKGMQLYALKTGKANVYYFSIT